MRNSSVKIPGQHFSTIGRAERPEHFATSVDHACVNSRFYQPFRILLDTCGKPPPHDMFLIESQDL